MARSTAGQRKPYLPTLQEGDMVIAIDPGETTGLATFAVRADVADDLVLMEALEIPWDERFRLEAYVQATDHIVIESFRLYAHKAKEQINNSFPSAQVIGMVDAYAHRWGKYERIREQPASQIARVQVLERHLYEVKGSEHRKDAYKHGRLFITLCKKEWD